MIDPASCKILPGSHWGRIAVAMSWLCYRSLVGASTWLRVSTSKMAFLTTVVAVPVIWILNWHLCGLLSLHVLSSSICRLINIGALKNLTLRCLITLHGGLGPLLELGLLMGPAEDEPIRSLELLLD
jgi:hypothetical protein